MPQWYVAGRSSYGHAGYAAARARWSDPDMAQQRDLSGKHFVVTGANAGLGFAIAAQLASRSADVHMVCRDAGRADAARREIVERAEAAGVREPRVHVHLADLGSMASVRAFAAAFAEQNTALHGLVNNAGALFNVETRSADGREMTMAVALNGSFLLTGLLLPLLQSAPHGGRVVNVSSGGQYLVSVDRRDLLGEGNAGAAYNGTAAYSLAKRVQVELTKQWAAEPAARGVVFHSMHPGWAVTPGATASISDFVERHKHMMRDMEQGADTAVWLAIADEPAASNGRFWLDREEARTDMRLAGTSWSDEDRAELWKKCEEACGWAIRRGGEQ
ncbi:hypothetical protein PybrP1_006394 [[Pythium] brassicae (nom. inval.)]|nr:hypothetical protein PybrP1_006394 [[Pythium] brassicae (nom. inval.)]